MTHVCQLALCQLALCQLASCQLALCQPYHPGTIFMPSIQLRFSAGTASTSTNPQGLEKLLKFYTSPAASKAIRDSGLEPIAQPR